MNEIEELAIALREHVPGANATDDIEVLREYAIDGLLPRLVVLPGTAEEMAQVVALTNRSGLTVLARGGGSHMGMGSMPERLDVLVGTKKLARVLEYEAADLTCHVEAGLTLAALQAQLAEKGQWLALDPPDGEQATVGGIVASNASGPKRLRYGTARDLVIGLRTVQADGEIARSGGRVVKNVAGYDLNKLYIGSLGTLGIIADVNFKLSPLPAAERTLLLTFTNAADAMRAVITVQGSLLTPSALELIDAGAASDMSDFYGVDLPTTGYTLAVNFEGGRVAIERQMHETRLLARLQNALIGDELAGEAQERLWDVVRAYTRGTVTCKVAIVVSRVAQYVQSLEQVCRRHRLEATVVAHAGNGIVYVALRPGDATARLVAAITELREHALAARGSLVVEYCPVELKRKINVWGEPATSFYLMQRLKERFDPKGTFVRGRFVGGL